MLLKCASETTWR